METKHGSDGGKARKEKLTPEQRTAIASAASNARWAKKKAAQAAPVQAPEPEPQPVVSKKAKKRSLPPEFGKAHSYAEKRLATAIRERAEAMQRVAMLNAEIPSLVDVIRALGGTVPKMSEQGGMTPVPYDASNPALAANGGMNLPPIPMARGSAMGVIGGEPQTDEDMFLRDSGSIASGGGWR